MSIAGTDLHLPVQTGFRSRYHVRDGACAEQYMMQHNTLYRGALSWAGFTTFACHSAPVQAERGQNSRQFALQPLWRPSPNGQGEPPGDLDLRIGCA
jgi:hypothetical protein